MSPSSPDNWSSIVLKRGHDRRVRLGHDWVFSNEINTQRCRLGDVEPGAPVRVVDAAQRLLGTGYANPHSLIAVRLASREVHGETLEEIFERRLQAATRFRERSFDKPYYRLVFGESDGVPGLVVDRYGDVLVAQISTAGIERMKGFVVDRLQALLSPGGIWLKNDIPLRDLEQLPRDDVVAFGGVPEFVVVPENGIEYEVPLREGQKTGWYYDQRENRALLGRWARGARVLDVFSYIGAWGLLAAHHGAADVVCLDRSESALQFAERSARRNGLSIRTMNVDAWEGLRDLRGQTFDIAILDPPALIKRRRDHAAGLQAYYRLNRLAAELLADDGLLISCSCSYHLAAEELFQVVDQAGRHVGRRAQVVAVGGQGIDHPVHPSMPETRYLKCLAVRLVRDLPLSGTPA